MVPHLSYTFVGLGWLPVTAPSPHGRWLRIFLIQTLDISYILYSLSVMDNQLKLRREHLSCLIEPTFNRTTVGYFSVTDALKVKLDETEKCSLVALKEVNKSQQGVIEYEVPNHIEEKDLTKGRKTYFPPTVTG